MDGAFDGREFVGAIVEQTETVVMPRGEHDVFHSGRLGGFHPRRHAGGGIELVGQFGVFLVGNLLVPLHPLAASGNGIKTPVNEHAEPCLAKPFSLEDFEAAVSDAVPAG